jgi:hypothetical protein
MPGIRSIGMLRRNDAPQIYLSFLHIPFHFDDFSAPLSKDITAPSIPWMSEKRFLKDFR